MALVVDGNGTLTGLTNATIPASKIGTGAVLQVVQATSTTNYTTTSASLVSSGFSCSITPTASTSRILILMQIALSNSGTGGGLAIARASSLIWTPAVSDGAGYYGSIYANGVTPRLISPMFYVDSPSTTSSTTYNLYFSARSGTTLSVNPPDSTTGASSIILMEIAG